MDIGYKGWSENIDRRNMKTLCIVSIYFNYVNLTGKILGIY